LLGIGGEKRWMAHAAGTAGVLNQIDPDFIRVRTFIPQAGSVLSMAAEAGDFQSASPETILKETQLLLEGLSVTSQFLSDHISNLLPLDGKLPEQKEPMLRMIEEVLGRFREDGVLTKEMEWRRHLTQL
jgi:hypothetical protein